MLNLLNCPKCKSTLVNNKGFLSCSSCHQNFPKFDGIPWLFQFPETVLLQWQARTSALLQMLESKKMRLEMEMRQTELLHSSKIRLEKLLTALGGNLASIREIMEPLTNYKGFDPANIISKIEEKVAAEQTLESYFANIFRDWSWNTQENTASLKIIEKVVPNGFKPENILFLGCGAGRLAVDLHKKLDPDISIAADINPLMLLLLNGLLMGKSFSLWEVPIAPLSIDEVAVEHSIKTSNSNPEGFELLFADGCNLPLKSKSVDCVVTSWFVDVVSPDFRGLAKRINTYLKKGGVWLNLGPLGFHHQRYSENYVINEVNDIVNESGFIIKNSAAEDLPYLQSPFSGQKRTEKVYLFAAEKASEAKEPAFFSSLPKWLTDTGEIIPQTHSVLREVSYHQIAFQILGAVDGKTSVDTIVKNFAAVYKISETQAQQVVVGFFTEWLGV